MLRSAGSVMSGADILERDGELFALELNNNFSLGGHTSENSRIITDSMAECLIHYYLQSAE